MVHCLEESGTIFGHSVSWTFFLSHLHYSSVDHMRSWGEALEVFTQLAVSDVTEHKIVGIGRSFRFPKIETKKLGNSRLESNMKHLCVVIAFRFCNGLLFLRGRWCLDDGKVFLRKYRENIVFGGWYGESSFLLPLRHNVQLISFRGHEIWWTCRHSPKIYRHQSPDKPFDANFMTPASPEGSANSGPKQTQRPAGWPD